MILDKPRHRYIWSQYIWKRGVNPLIQLSARRQISTFPKMSNSSQATPQKWEMEKTVMMSHDEPFFMFVSPLTIQKHLPLTVSICLWLVSNDCTQTQPSPSARISEECDYGQNVAKSCGSNSEEEEEEKEQTKTAFFFRPLSKKRQKSGIPFCAKQKIMQPPSLRTHTFVQTGAGLFQ